MKKISSLFLLSIVIFCSCNKDSSNPVSTNIIPSTPILITPIDSAAGVAIPATFTWKVTVDADSFSLQISLGNTFDNLVFNKSGLTGTSTIVPGLNNLTIYFWRIRAVNKNGESDWSKVRSFTSSGPLPTISDSLYPANNSINVTVPPTLIWNPTNGTVTYTLQISKDSLFTSSEFYQSGLTKTSKQVWGFSFPTHYYWHINATNNYGTSDWSKIMSFTTTGPNPNTPVLTSPTNNISDISLTPTLIWNESSGATSYTLQVSTDNQFSNYVYNISGLSGTSQQITTLNDQKLYYWRVIAVNIYGTSYPSSVWSFTTGINCGTSSIIYSGKTYHTVQIGNQCWMKENLDVGTRINGSILQTNNGIIEKYCYNDDPNMCGVYGGIYQWAETVQYQNGASNTTSPNPPLYGNVQGICPSGWHIPNNGEFINLSTAVNNDGNALKREDQGNAQGIGTNISGFSGLLSGCTVNGESGDLGYSAIFWSSMENNSTQAYIMWLDDGDSTTGLGTANKVPMGSSVRCLKD